MYGIFIVLILIPLGELLQSRCSHHQTVNISELEFNDVFRDDSSIHHFHRTIDCVFTCASSHTSVMAVYYENDQLCRCLTRFVCVDSNPSDDSILVSAVDLVRAGTVHDENSDLAI